MLERRQPLLQLDVERHRPGNAAHRAGANAVVVNGLLGGGAHAGMVGQPQVVVGAKVEQAAAVDGHPGVHRRVEGANVVIKTGGPQVIDLRLQPGSGSVLHVITPKCGKLPQIIPIELEARSSRVCDLSPHP